MSEPAEPRRRGRWLGVSAVAAGIVVLFAVAGFFVAPPIVKSAIETRLGRVVDRPVTIGRVRCNPFALSVTVDGLSVADRDGERLLGWDRLYVNLLLWPWIRGEYGFDAIEVDGLAGRLVMEPDGSLNVSDIVKRLSAPEAAPPKDEGPLRMRAGRLRVGGATFSWTDRTREPAFTTTLGPFAIALDRFRTPSEAGSPYTFSGRTETGETFAWKGSVGLDPPRSEGEIVLGGIDVAKYRPYFADAVGFEVRAGTADVKAAYRFSWEPRGHVALLDAVALSVRDVRLTGRDDDETVVEVPAIDVPEGRVDILGRTIDVPRIVSRGGSLLVRVARDGTVNLQRLLEAPRPPAAAPAAAASPQTASEPWRVSAGEVALSGYRVHFESLQPARPVVVDVEDAGVVVKGASTEEKSTPDAKVTLRLAGGGSIDAEGRMHLATLRGDAKVAIDRLPLAPYDPYLEDTYALRISAGTASGAGQVVFDLGQREQVVWDYRGDLAIDGFVAVDEARAEEFLRWKALRLDGVAFAVVPPSLGLREISVDDPVLRCVVAENGRLNLAEVLRVPPAEPGPRVDEEPDEPEPPPATEATQLPPTVPAPGLERPIKIGRVRITNGTLAYQDRASDPDVAVKIGGLTGTLDRISTDSLSRGDVAVTGSVEGVAPVELSGRINPLIAGENSDFALAIRGADLLPFSPYCGRWVGYPIEKGKLDLDLHWKIASRRIASENVATIDQLALGAKTGSPDATKLPVKFGLALLRDRQGKIVMDVPVQGSVDDPKFKPRRLIVRAIVNIFKKAATSPFALLGRLGGRDAAELSTVAFPAGSAAPGPEGAASVDALAKALFERPELKLEVAGAADPAADAAALRAARLEDRLRAAKWKAGEAAGAASAAETTITPGERARWLEAAFYDAFPDARPAPPPPAPPRKRGEPAPPPPPPPPPPDPAAMEARLLASIEVTPDDLRALAAARAGWARDRVVASGPVEPERVFLVDAPASGAGAARVAFKLQ